MNTVSVIARIRGGLGNQLFCYAAAKRLAFVNKLPLKLDIVSGFKRDFQYNRQYLLHQFNIHAEVASRREMFDFPGGCLCRYVIKRLNRVIKFEDRFYLTEASIYSFDDRILKVKPCHTLYIEGSWQSEKYFKDIAHIIKNDLKIVMAHEPIAIKEVEQIRRVQHPICLGIRRYQEVTKPGMHRALPVEYYLRAIEKIVAQINNPHFFIVSDDGTWAEEHITVPYPRTFITVKPENERAYEDLWLMSFCHHFIISNSSYHWWGAWLSESKNKIVIAPDRGFYNRDTIPDDWIKIEV